MSPVNKWVVGCDCECGEVACGDVMLPRRLYISYSYAGTVDRCSDFVLSGDFPIDASPVGTGFASPWTGFSDECFCDCAVTHRHHKFFGSIVCRTDIGNNLQLVFTNCRFSACADDDPPAGGCSDGGGCGGNAFLLKPYTRPFLKTRVFTLPSPCYPCSEFGSAPVDLPRLTSGILTVTVSE